MLQLLEGWRWRDHREKQLLAYTIAALMNPHLKKPIDMERIYHDLLGDEEVARIKAADHKGIIRERRRVTVQRTKTHGYRR